MRGSSISSIRAFLLVATGLFLSSAGLHAQVVVTGYTETGNLARNDDNYSSAIDLGFSINFGGTTFSQTYVSNNGYLTFGGGDGEYSPSPLNTSYNGLPIIAVFFSDVDTRNEATNIVSWGTGTVGGRAAFVAKWPGVGEYSHGSVLNNFEVILVSRSDTGAGNFDVFFNYNQIVWDHGKAVAGFHTGSEDLTPAYYQLPGSMQEGAFLNGGPNALTGFSNSGSAGDFLLQARGGDFLTPAQIVAVPEPSTYALLALGAGMLFVTQRRRRL